MALTVGNLGIDGLEDIEQIGTGGSSRVYRARQAELDRVVALKVLNPGYDESVSRRFDRERKAMGRLSLHEGIVPVYTSGVTVHGEPYLVMPYYANGSLQDQIDTGAMEWQTAVSYVDVAAETIAEAHDEGVVHLDLKPANILLTNNGAPRIADFGIAKLTSGHGANAATTGGAAFTPAYSAPETFLDGETGRPSDVYGLGATLWALLVGHPPFLTPGDDTNLMAVINRVVNNEVGDLRHFTPSAICDVIERAMAKRPEDRYQTAREFSTSLKQAAAESSADFVPAVAAAETSLFATSGFATTAEQDRLLQQAPAHARAVPVADGGAGPLLQEQTAPAGDFDPSPPAVQTPLIDLDRFRPGPIVLGLLAFLAMAGLGYWGLSRTTSGSGGTETGTIEIPVTEPAAPSLESTVLTTPNPAVNGAQNGEASDGGVPDGRAARTDTTNPAETTVTPSTPASETTAKQPTTTQDPSATTATDEDPTGGTTEPPTTSEPPTTVTPTEPPPTTEAPTTTVATTTPPTTEPPTTLPATDPPTVSLWLTTSDTRITMNITADQCISYRVSLLDLAATDPVPIVVSGPDGGGCGVDHSLRVSNLTPGTTYRITVIGTNESGQTGRVVETRATKGG